MNWELTAVIAEHQGRSRTKIHHFGLTPGQATAITSAGASCDFTLTLVPLDHGTGNKIRLKVRCTAGSARGISLGLCWTDHSWSEENYVLIPGSVYQGNRFDALKRGYPPGIRDLGQRDDKQRLDIGDIPRLSNLPGPSHIDQLSVDASIPGMGVFFPERKRGWLLLTGQMTSLGAYGLEVIENGDRSRADLLWLTPGFLHPLAHETGIKPAIGDLAAAHLHPENGYPVDWAAGAEVLLEAELHEFDADTPQALFSLLMDRRKACFPDDPPLPNILPISAASDLIHSKQNAQNWNEDRGIYQVGLPWLPRQDSQFWQNGWIGGGLATLPLYLEGDASSRERSKRNMDFLLREGVSERGLFKAIMSPSGTWYGDGYADWDGGPEPHTLSRRNGDCLLFALRMLHQMRRRNEPIPPSWESTLRKSASALCEIWHQEADFGYLIDYETGRVVIGGSTSGALIPAALVMAGDYFQDQGFLRVAGESAEHYAKEDLARAVTTGGPGDAAQAPDCESAFSLVESFIALYEATGEARWLQASLDAIAQASSWVISYRHRFPEQSTFAKLGIDARGTMLANAQNKCGVPGICTLSGVGLLRAFRASGDHRVLEVLREIAHSLPQFVSREDRPIAANITWGHPGKSFLPPGWICERVNVTPSWNEPLGEQAAYSCWCEVALMLTWSDLPGVYAQSDTGLICCLDHILAEWMDSGRHSLRLTNPTDFPARVKILAETAEGARRHPLPTNFGSDLPQVQILPHSSRDYLL
ncbi:MAG: hypothetical protein SFU85_12410 [Candidatus Methylacidiphilales bacterium]|nr:hypothetical protein [Candidatus Methylacidiphilales bacterium]